MTPAALDIEALRAFVDAWSEWALNRYVATDVCTRDNLRLLRSALGMEEAGASDSWDVDRLYGAMADARTALAGKDGR